jgi:ABC-type multidrug transport system permease subunit
MIFSQYLHLIFLLVLSIATPWFQAMSVFIPAAFLFYLTLDPLVPPLPIIAAAILPLVTGFEDIFRVKKEMKVKNKKKQNK